MTAKKVTLASLLLAGTGVPYLLSHPDAQATLQKAMGSSQAASASAGSAPAVDPSASSSGGLFSSFWADTPKVPSVNAPTYPLHELIRFDVTPRSVIERFPRVTTTLSEQGLEGLRVAVITGVTPSDLAGSLTYYFDKQHRVQRLTLNGYMGDDSQLVALVVQHYQFAPEPTLGAGLYAIKWGGRPISALRVCHAPVVRAASQYSRLEVRLEINRPEGQVRLSEEFQQLLDHDRYVQRW